MNCSKLVHTRPLPRSFYQRDTVEVACDLLGTLLLRMHHSHCLVGRIVETEAYCGTIDPASHAARGKTMRNAPLFGQVGHAYVYLIYGLHYGFNVVARDAHTVAGGILIRAIEPLEGIKDMMLARHVSNIKQLTNGPGKLSQALGITLSDTGIDLTSITSTIRILPRETHDRNTSFEYETRPRVGITSAQEKLWRFVIPGNSWISRR